MQKLSKIGAFPSQTIREMIEAGCITGAKDENVQPASLDLSISDEVYEIEGIFQPRHDETIRDVLSLVRNKKHDLSGPLQKGKLYLAKLSETFDLPESVYGYCNPKSTTGRLDLHVRVLADRVSRYDTLAPRGWSGELWLLIIPNSFSVKIPGGHPLSQVRFFSGDTRFDELSLELAMKKDKLIWRSNDGGPLSYGELYVRDGDGYAILTAGLKNSEIAGYRAVETDEVIDLANVGGYDPALFFAPITLEDNRTTLRRGEFYILSTNESVRIPNHLTSEMVPMDERSGDFRSHYAGFLDPGWGMGKDGDGNGRPFTLEVRPFEDVFVRHNQPIAKIRFERLTAEPEEGYDEISSNYTVQPGPKLAKQFKSTE